MMGMRGTTPGYGIRRSSNLWISGMQQGKGNRGEGGEGTVGTLYLLQAQRRRVGGGTWPTFVRGIMVWRGQGAADCARV